MKKIYYKRTLPTKRVKVANFKGVSKDWYSKTLPVDFAVKQENLRTLNGVLVDSLSPKLLEIQFDEKIDKIIPFYAGTLQLMVVCESKIYIYKEVNGEITKSEIAKDFQILDSSHYKYGEEDYLIFATDSGLKKFDNGTFEDSEVETEFATICNHYYRLFGAEKNSSKLMFSDDFAPFDWEVDIDKGGYINLPFDNGVITDLISYNQYLIVCQEDGFTRITAYSEQDEFVVKSITTPNNIKKGSVVNCGDYVMYATNKGLGIFDGYDCKTICEELSGFFEKCDIKAEVVGEFCYFLCKERNNPIGDSYIIAFNLQYKDYHFITCNDANSIVKVKYNGSEYLLIACSDCIKLLSSEISSANKIWATGNLDFGSPAEYKLLKRIVFGGKSIVDLKITVDGENYFFNIAHQREHLLNLKGKQFEIEIMPKGRVVNLPSPVLEYTVLEEN